VRKGPQGQYHPPPHTMYGKVRFGAPSSPLSRRIGILSPSPKTRAILRTYHRLCRQSLPNVPPPPVRLWRRFGSGARTIRTVTLLILFFFMNPATPDGPQVTRVRPSPGQTGTRCCVGAGNPSASLFLLNPTPNPFRCVTAGKQRPWTAILSFLRSFFVGTPGHPNFAAPAYPLSRWAGPTRHPLPPPPRFL